jgi:hypothetical protein
VQFDPRELFVPAPFGERDKHLFFVPEVCIDRALREACCLGNVVDRRRVEAALDE